MGEAYGQLMSKRKRLKPPVKFRASRLGSRGHDASQAGPLRAEQLAWLSRTSHSMMVDTGMGDALAAAEAEGANDEVGRFRLIRDGDKATKKPADLSSDLPHKSKSTSHAELERKRLPFP